MVFEIEPKQGFPPPGFVLRIREDKPFEIEEARRRREHSIDLTAAQVRELFTSPWIRRILEANE